MHTNTNYVTGCGKHLFYKTHHAGKPKEHKEHYFLSKHRNLHGLISLFKKKQKKKKITHINSHNNGEN